MFIPTVCHVSTFQVSLILFVPAIGAFLNVTVILVSSAVTNLISAFPVSKLATLTSQYEGVEPSP